jgi:Tfp pilus assembly PilM family ATPase
LNVDYQKLDAFAQNVTTSLINNISSAATTTHNATAGIPGAGIIHSILSVPMLEEQHLAFCLDLC